MEDQTEDQTKLTAEPTTESKPVAPTTAPVETPVTPEAPPVPAEKAPESEELSSGVQKRINKVVAQKMVVIDQNQKLKERNRELEALLASRTTTTSEDQPESEVSETQEEPDLMTELDKIDDLPDEQVPTAATEAPKVLPSDQQAFIEELQTERRNEAYATMLGNIAKEFPGVDPNKVTGAMLRDNAGWSDTGGQQRMRTYFQAAQAEKLAAEVASLHAKVGQAAGDIHTPSGIPPAHIEASSGDVIADSLAYLAELRGSKKKS